MMTSVPNYRTQCSRRASQVIHIVVKKQPSFHLTKKKKKKNKSLVLVWLQKNILVFCSPVQYGHSQDRQIEIIQLCLLWTVVLLSILLAVLLKEKNKNMYLFTRMHAEMQFLNFYRHSNKKIKIGLYIYDSYKIWVCTTDHFCIRFIFDYS